MLKLYYLGQKDDTHTLGIPTDQSHDITIKVNHEK